MKSEFKNLPSGWRVVRLGEIAKKSILKNRNNSIKLVLSNSAINGLVAQNEYFDKDIANKENIQDYYIVHLGDFVYNPRISQNAPTGPINRNMFSKGIVSPLYTVFSVQDETLAKFLAYFFQTIVWQNQVKSVANYGARHDRINITDNTFFSLKILLPPLVEQEKIAEILSTWDEAINLTINLIENKKRFKKALMQNLLTAKIRFPEFKDEWEETILGKICDISTGTSKSRFIGNGKFYIVDMGSITQDGLLNSTKTTNLSKDFLDCGDLVMPKDDIGGGKIIGKVAVINKDNTYVLSDHIFRIKTTENSNFLAYLINYDLNNKKIRREVSGTAQFGLGRRTIENLKIFVPSLNEQQKIAGVLTACDDEINLLNLKLENLKKQKQGLMQKLLKGEIRTCHTKKTMQ